MRIVTPATVDDAVAHLNSNTGLSRILAGGTDVLVQLRLGMVQPDLVVDIKNIHGMRDIQPENGGYRVGAAVSGAELGEHDGMKSLWPGVVEAMELVGSTQVQGRATLTGNLCNASPAADSVPAMIAANAIARISGVSGSYDIPVGEVVTGPGKTVLKKGDLITSFLFPNRPENSADAYLRFIPRTEMDIAVASAGVSLALNNNKVTDARVVLGAVAPTAVLVEEGAKAIIGTSLDDHALKKLATACSAACNPIDDKRGTIEFRTKTAGVLAKRAAAIAFQRAGGKA